MNSEVLLDALLQGRLPGKKEFCLYYLELTTSKFNIFDKQESELRKHVHSMQIKASDTAGIESKVRKGEIRFYFSHSEDGRYIFKVPSEAIRDNWISQLRRVINKKSLEAIDGFRKPTFNAFNPDNVFPSQVATIKFDIPTVPALLPGQRIGGASLNVSTLPGRGKTTKSLSTVSPRVSIISTDSGIGTSMGGVVCRPLMHKSGSVSVPSSGSGTISREGRDKSSQNSPNSADSMFRERVGIPGEESTPKWFWDIMSRQECEEKLKSKAEMGNFVVRINATGHYIMSFWRIDGIHHHKILNHEGMWRFERAAVNAEGESLADLLDTYMKNCSKDKNIKPFGGGLFENYTYAWNPQPFDMAVLSKKLKEQKEKKKSKAPCKWQEYTQVEVDSGMNNEEIFENDPLPAPDPTGGKVTPKPKLTKVKPLPLVPTKKKTVSESTSSRTFSPKRVAPAPPPAKSKPTNKQSTSSQKQSSSGGAGEEVIKRSNSEGQKIPKATHPLNTSTHHLHGDSSHTSLTQSQDMPGEEEPMYANTSSNSLSQPTPDDSHLYQNCDFNGPPRPDAALTTAETSSVAATGDQDHYQNFTFQSQKAVKHSTNKKKVAKAIPCHSSQEHRHKTASRVNGSASRVNGSASPTEEEGNFYQNIEFRKT